MLSTTIDGPKIYFYFNKIKLGYSYMECDGFWVFMFENADKGFWNEYSLTLISEKLKEMNKGWNDYIKENLK